MNRTDFVDFTARTLEDIILLAEEKCGKTLPRKLAFRWLGGSHSLVTENIAEYIVQRVYVDEDHIYPCVDIGVGDLLDDGSLLVVASVAGYAPRPFGKNWTGRDGPYVRIVGQAFLERMAAATPDRQNGSRLMKGSRRLSRDLQDHSCAETGTTTWLRLPVA